MKNLFFIIISILALVGCTNTNNSTIRYYSEGDIIYFNNKNILLEINDNMKIKPYYNDRDRIQTIASDDSKPNDFNPNYALEIPIA